MIREELEYETLIQEEENRAEREKREKQARKAKKAGKQTVSLTSTPRALHSHQKTRGNGSSKPTQEAPTSDLSSEPERPNVWARTDSTILYLSTLLSIPSGALSSLFYSNNNSLPLALSKIMDTAEPLYSSIADGPQKLAELRDLFPEKSENTLLRCLCATGGDDLGRAVELVKALEDLYAREGTPLAHGLLLNARISDPRSSKSALTQPLPRAPVPVPGSAVNGLVAGGQRAGERPPSVSDCVLLATTLRAKRDDAYRSAARTWRSKHALGNSGVAAYWAEHGRELDRQAREWELRAARATVEDRRRVARSVHSVDLHGLTVQQALTVTQECLTAWWTGACRPNPSVSPKLTMLMQSAASPRPRNVTHADHSDGSRKALCRAKSRHLAGGQEAPRAGAIRLPLRWRARPPRLTYGHWAARTQKGQRWLVVAFATLLEPTSNGTAAMPVVSHDGDHSNRLRLRLSLEGVASTLHSLLAIAAPPGHVAYARNTQCTDTHTALWSIITQNPMLFPLSLRLATDRSCAAAPVQAGPSYLAGARYPAPAHVPALSDTLPCVLAASHAAYGQDLMHRTGVLGRPEGTAPSCVATRE